MATDPQDVIRFGERMRVALPAAISEAFGGVTELRGFQGGALPLQVLALGSGRHLHLEIEAVAGRHEPRNVALVMRAQDGQRLFGLEDTPEEELGNPETQLRVLAEFTEGAEALATALAGALAGTGLLVSLRVSGASLEEAAASPAAAAAPLGSGDAVSFSGALTRPGGPPMPIIVAAPADLMAALAGTSLAGDTAPGGGPIAAGSTAAERAADLAARVASRRGSAAAEPSPSPVSAPAPSGASTPSAGASAVSAHPVSFGQLDPGPAHAPRADRSVDLILDVALQVRVELGSTQMTVEEVLGLCPGSVVELDRLAGEPVDIVINDRLIARGEVVVIEENFGVRVTEIVTARSRAAALT